MERLSREALLYALLFGVPSGIGVASVVDITLSTSAAYVVLSGVLGALLVAGFVLLLTVTGSETP